MLLLMRSKKHVRVAAIKTTDHALTNHKTGSERFVDALGLKSAFSAFMGKGTSFISQFPPPCFDDCPE